VKEATTALAASTLFTAYIGIDWADRKHDFCLQGAGSTAVEFGVIDNKLVKQKMTPRPRLGDNVWHPEWLCGGGTVFCELSRETDINLF
jgi:ribosomal protein L4